MFRTVVFLTYLLAFQLGLAQPNQQPVFKTQSDSIQFYKIQALRLKIMEDGGFPSDSLQREDNKLRSRVTWQYIYTPNKTYTSYADLKNNTVNPEEVKRLSISGLKAYQIPNEVLACKNLTAIELVNTSIDKIPESLNQLKNLNTLHIFNNRPSKRLILEKNSTISYLRIAGYDSDKLPNSYKNFTGLDSLNLNRSGAIQFPKINKNKSLTKLTLVENNITLKRFKGSTTLKHLDLRRNKVTTVPNSIGKKFSALSALSFNSNPVKRVKPGLGKLKDLEYLSFYFTGIREIPKSVYQLSNLKVIDLFDNNIEAVDPAIKNLQELEVLYLANNKIYRLPEEIGQLKSLKSLYIYNNRIDTLPPSMEHLDSLKILWINDNFFHTMPATAWQLKSLHDLDASENFIKHIPPEIGDTKLSILIIAGDLLPKEKENPELFEKLRLKGTKIIYYNASGFSTD